MFQSRVSELESIDFPYSMKKLMSIFLMLWLPLFMSSAWAMDLQISANAPMQEVAAMAEMPCHNMQASIEPADAGCKNCPEHTADMHNCATCGLCMISLSATQIELFATSLIATPSNAISLPDSAFFSQDYRPAIKPPIHS